MEQQIRFCTTPDGVRIAYCIIGRGYPLVWTPYWVSHLDLVWEHEPYLRALAAFSQHFTLIMYDNRGTGLSDRSVTDFSLEARVRDLTGLVDYLDLESFALHALSEGGPTALAFTARHPERVRRLALYATFARGDFLQPEVAQALLTLVSAEWGMGSETLASLFMPDSSPETLRWFRRLQQEGASSEAAAGLLRESFAVDVSHLLKDIVAPTFVAHARNDRAVPADRGREVAAGIPGARFHLFDSSNHLPDADISDQLAEATIKFLREDEQAWWKTRHLASVEGSITVLFTDVEGSTVLTQRLGDIKARELLRAHEEVVRTALASHGGTELKTMGDGFMASFQSSGRALECAIAIQRSMQERNLTAGEPLQVRIGLNAGEPVAEGGDLFGTAVNLAARIASKAEGGEVLVSDVVRQLVAGKGFLFADRGGVALRGFEDPVRLYELRWREER